MDRSLPDSSVHGIFQARILEWVAISFSRESNPGLPHCRQMLLPSEPPGKSLRDLRRLFCLMFRLCSSPVQGAGTVPLCTLLQLSQVTQPLRPESDRLHLPPFPLYLLARFPSAEIFGPQLWKGATPTLIMSTTATIAEYQAQNKAKLISEVRRRFEAEYVTDKSDKYDSRDVERLQQDDNWIESYLAWRHNVVDETLKMLDESFQWRKEMAVNDLTEASIPRWLLEIGGIYLHGYDKEGNKLFWIRVKYHIKDHKTILDKKKLIAFWLERYAKRENGKPVTVMFDLSETGLNSIDMDFVRFIINCFKVYYPKYLSKMVIFDMPWIMNAAFKIVKTWLGPEAVSLLKFTSKNDIQDYVSVEYLPPHMGGTDPFKYSYPPLVDDDFQTPLCENGPIASEDEASSKEDIESDGKDTLETISNEEQTTLPKKGNIMEPTSKADENEKVDSKMRTFKKPLSVFKGPLLHISPAEELYFGSTDSGEKKALIVLTNVTKNIVAFKVRTTAPEKYRVKPSNSSCDPGASVDIVVSPHGGLTVSAQDRFLVMAAEMEQTSGTGPAELTQFWKEVPRNKVMEHRLRCHIVESYKPSSLTWKDHAFNMSVKTSEDLCHQLSRLVASTRKLEDQVQQCIRFQQLLLALTVLLLTFMVSFFYLLHG